MGEPYLILHKVRGEPAFDVAIQIEIDGEEEWIIPTSGHRAYPFWCILLDEVDFLNGKHPNEYLHTMPSDWPDHYSQKPAEVPSTNLLQILGLTKKIERRI